MEGLNYPEYDESFLKGPSAVVELMDLLETAKNAFKEDDPRDDKKKEPQPAVDISADVTDDNYFISSRSHGYGRGRRSTRRTRSKAKAVVNLNQFTFMRQIDQTYEERAQARSERVRVASNFRRLGNSAYRKDQIPVAIEMYTKGLEYIRDTPVLFLNLACCYIKLRQFKLAIIECDHILTALDPKYIRAFLYKALAYKRMNDEKSFEDCIFQVKRIHSRSLEFIDNFLEKMRSG